MQHANLREVSYRQKAPLPPLPPRRLTRKQRSEAWALRGVGTMALGFFSFLALMLTLKRPWAEVWPAYWHAVVFVATAVLVPALLVAWTTWRLWRDETLGGGE